MSVPNPPDSNPTATAPSPVATVIRDLADLPPQPYDLMTYGEM